jgi:hypothetical protein
MAFSFVRWIHWALATSLLVTRSNALTPNPGFLSHGRMIKIQSPCRKIRHSRRQSSVTGIDDDDDFLANKLVKERSNLEGFGFSTPMKQILKESKRNLGFVRASASDTVLDVMEAISSGIQDVALVVEDGSEEVLGLFTETDYVKVGSIMYYIVS